METLFFVKSDGIWWGPYVSFVEAQKTIKNWNDSIHEYIENGSYSKDYKTNLEFEILEVPIKTRTKVRYLRQTKNSRVETLEPN